MSSKYTLLEAVVGKNQRLLMGDEIEEVPAMDGRPGYRLTEEGVKDGIARLTWVTATFNDRGLHRVMGEAVYANVGSWEFYEKPFWASLAFFVLALFVAAPKDRARRMLYKHGRRLRGPELVTTSEFNEKLGKSNLLRVQLPDGVAFINEEQTWWEKTFHKDLSRWARVPREREAIPALFAESHNFPVEYLSMTDLITKSQTFMQAVKGRYDDGFGTIVSISSCKVFVIRGPAATASGSNVECGVIEVCRVTVASQVTCYGK